MNIKVTFKIVSFLFPIYKIDNNNFICEIQPFGSIKWQILNIKHIVTVINGYVTFDGNRPHYCVSKDCFVKLITALVHFLK